MWNWRKSTADAEPTEVQDLSTPLGAHLYPATRNGNPDDDEALARIDNLLAAFEDKFALEDAVRITAKASSTPGLPWTRERRTTPSP